MRTTKNTVGLATCGYLAAALVLTLLLPTDAAWATGSGGALLRAEREVLGTAATGSWHGIGVGEMRAFDQIGGDGLDEPRPEIGGSGGTDRDPGDDGASSATMGEKAKVGALSALLPGAGQFVNGQRSKAYLMAGIEVGIWTAYFVFDKQGDNRMDSSHEWAALYAGTSGSHDDRYWQGLGKYMDSDAYNDFLLWEARANQEPFPTLVTGSDTWQWVNVDRRTGYQKLRADGNSAYDRRDFMILFAVVNRAVSVVDAVLGAGSKPGVLDAEVLGMNLEVKMLPSWRDPGAQCALSRSF